jgi:hypothetical protein
MLSHRLPRANPLGFNHFLAINADLGTRRQLGNKKPCRKTTFHPGGSKPMRKVRQHLGR